MIPRIFEGQPVFVVAGGPSLIGFDWSRLHRKNVIAVNRALEVVPTAPVLWWTDAKFWWHNRQKIIDHEAPHKATCNLNYGDNAPPSYVHQYRITGHKGFDEDPHCLRSGNNSGHAAIHLAAHTGANLIVALGLDMRHGPAGQSHFHSGHGMQHQERTLTDLMLPWFGPLADALAERKIMVINASPNSALTCWPRCTIDEGLGHYEKAAALM